MCHAIIIVCGFSISWKWFVTHSNNSGSKIYTETADLLRKHGGKTGEELKAEKNETTPNHNRSRGAGGVWAEYSRGHLDWEHRTH